MVLVLTLLSIVIFAALGWFRGFVRLAIAVGALLLAGVLAKPLAFLSSWLMPTLGVPILLQPVASAVTTGLLLFLIFLIAAALKVNKSKEEDRPAWDRPAGAVLGGAWGLGLALLVMVGLSVVGRADRAMRQSMAESEIRNQARQEFIREAQEEVSLYRAGLDRQAFEAEVMALVAEAERNFELDPAELRSRTETGPLDGFLEDLKVSPLDGIVDNASPFNEKAEKTLRDLTIVVSDPVLMDRFKNHPDVRKVMQEPKILEVSEDQEVARMVLAGEYRQLMDHPKLIALAQDPKVRTLVDEANLPDLLDKIRQGR